MATDPAGGFAPPPSAATPLAANAVDAPLRSHRTGSIEPACALCATRLVGPYCHACGQASTAAQRSFGEIFTGQTGRLLHTMRMLLTRPGELAREIDEGRDRRSMRPLTLLLNLIPLFFLLGGGNGGFGVRMFESADTTGSMEMAIVKRAERKSLTVPVMKERVEQRFRVVYSLLVVVQAATYGLAIGLAERRRRKSWLVHFAAGIHYMCLSFIVSTLVFGAFRLAGAPVTDHPVLASSAIVVNLTWLALALRRTYGDSPIRAGVLAVLVMGVNNLVAMALTGSALVVALLTA